MKHLRLTSIAFSLTALCMLGMTQPGAAQPHRDNGAQNAEKQERPRGRLGIEVHLDPEALRIRLQQLIERGQDMAQRGQSALDKLDAGASASEVLNELRDTSSPRRAKNEPRDTDAESRRPGGRPDERRARAGSSDEREAIYRFLQQEFPELWENIEPFLKQDPRNAERLLGRMAPQIREILALQKSQPELARIKTEQMRAGLDFVEAARLYRLVLSNPDATQSERESALGTIRTHAEARFDAELQAKQLEIARLEARLDQLRGSISELENRRDQEVEQMVTGAQRNAVRLARQQAQRQQQPGDDSGSGDD